jgi:phosphomannomutase
VSGGVKTSADDLELPPPVRRSIARWLGDSRYASERAGLEQTLARARAGDTGALAELADAFAGPLPIGTGGRRGPCGPGPNRVNAVVARETAQALVLALREPELRVAERTGHRVAIAFDTRRDSERLARIVAAQLAQAGCRALVLGAPRSTPQLSFLVRREGCSAGVVISASHNPPEDNGLKIYGPDGAQVLGATDAAMTRAIVRAAAEPLPPIDVAALDAGRVPAGVEILDPGDPRADPAYLGFVAAQGVLAGDLGDAALSIVFTPLHGVGHHAVLPVLRARGLAVAGVERQCDPDHGRFSTVRSANPEVPESMAMAIEQARAGGADLVVATDPDADRLGACVRAGAEFVPLDGNRLGVLMLDHVLRHARLPPRGWVLTTMVTSPLIGALARARGVDVVDDLLVGFKHHAGMMREQPDRELVFACEESHGYGRGNEVRDKDGAVAALLLAECAADCRRGGATLLDRLREIWRAFGYHRERTASLTIEGPAGRDALAAAMARLRAAPPAGVGGLDVRAVDDRSLPVGAGRVSTGSPTRDLPGDVLGFELGAADRACRLVFRPSGTEPKLKLYALARAAPGADPDALAPQVDALVEHVLADASRLARAALPEGG